MSATSAAQKNKAEGQGEVPKFKLPELQSMINSFHSAHFKWLHKFHGNILEQLSIENPELKIKLLEENFNLVNKKGIEYKALQMKSDVCSFNANTYLTNRSFNDESNSYTSFQSSLSLENTGKCTLQKKAQGENKLNTSCNCTVLHTSTNSQELEGQPTNTTSLLTSKNRLSYSETGQRSSSTHTVHTSSMPVDTHRDMKDEIDNQFKFTVEEEDIVSFVCSPSPSRGECSPTISYSIDSDDDCDTDSELTESTTTRGDSVMETQSNISCRSYCFEEPKIGLMDPSPTTNPCCCHLPVSPLPSGSHDSHNPVVGKVPVGHPSSDNRDPKTNGSFVNHVPYNSSASLSDDERLYTSLNQETILFREASLRGCYGIERILTHIKPPLTDVEKETSDVKGFIFSSVRPQKTNVNMVGGTVLSILAICKSWVTVNSHFERKEFKDTLQLQGVDPSLLNVFLQWQCVSRQFIDNMLQALDTIAPNKTFNSDSCKNESPIGSIPASIATNNQDFVHGRSYLNTVRSTTNSPNVLDLLQSKNKPPNNQIVLNKHWRHRRFLSDQHKANIHDSKSQRLLKSRFIEGSSCNGGGGTQFPIICNNEAPTLQSNDELTSVGQCMKSAKLKHLSNTTSNPFVQSHINFFPGTNSFPPTQVNNATVSTPSSYSSVLINSKVISNVGEGMLGSLNNIYANSVSTVQETPIKNYNPVITLNHPTVATNFLNITPSNEVHCNTVSNYVIKQNPNRIQCADTENCFKSNYIKPGSYNPPQKPINLQKVVDNNISIDDTPLLGIPFFYSNPLNCSQQTKPSDDSKCTGSNKKDKNSHKIDKSREKVCVVKSAFNVVDTKTVPEQHNISIKDSDSGILQTHRLFDETSSHSFSTNLNYENEIEYFICCENRTASKDYVEPQLNKGHWLTNSACKGNMKGEINVNLNKSCDSINDPENLVENTTFVCFEGADKLNNSISSIHRKDTFDDCAFVHGMNQKSKNKSNRHQNEVTVDTQKKHNKNKGFQDDFTTAKDLNFSVPLRKLKSTLKSSITKQVSEKLKTILDCLWNIEISSLVEPELNSEKEALSIELTVRNSLQALKCKLTNQGYDTLEQVRTDFERYFQDVKSRNKENKQCIDVVETLEKVFSSLVEKHFGIAQQLKPECVGTMGLFHGTKTRKSKKNFQRC